jgi:hypothetical protein
VRDSGDVKIKCVCASCPTPEELEEGGYNHPVVVLKIRQAVNSKKVGDLVCDVACVSLGYRVEARKWISDVETS